MSISVYVYFFSFSLCCVCRYCCIYMWVFLHVCACLLIIAFIFGTLAVLIEFAGRRLIVSGSLYLFPSMKGIPSDYKSKLLILAVCESSFKWFGMLGLMWVYIKLCVYRMLHVCSFEYLCFGVYLFDRLCLYTNIYIYIYIFLCFYESMSITFSLYMCVGMDVFVRMCVCMLVWVCIGV